jgi:hypothetical protein
MRILFVIDSALRNLNRFPCKDNIGGEFTIVHKYVFDKRGLFAITGLNSITFVIIRTNDDFFVIDNT